VMLMINLAEGAMAGHHPKVPPVRPALPRINCVSICV
jgi:hypothetical protein